MKSILYTSLLAIAICTNIVNAQQFGMNGDLIVGKGLKSMSATVPLHSGVSYGFFYSPKFSPFSFGYRNVLNCYSSYTKNELPFYREDYVHEVANISNTHSISQNILFSRIELFKNKGISPFVEVGGGYARYKSKWSATDPYESSNDNCEGYLDNGKILTSGTFIASASAGVNFKLNKLSGKNNCSGVWLTIALDYTRGGKVNYLNSELNNNQFYYGQGVPILTSNPRTGAATHDHQSIAPGGCYENYFDQQSFYERHEIMQVRMGVSMVMGNCK